jgi:hypothetical protein
LGDFITFKEFDPKTNSYSGESCHRKVTYKLELKIESDLPKANIYALFGDNKTEFWQSSDIKKYGFVILGIE